MFFDFSRRNRAASTASAPRLPVAALFIFSSCLAGFLVACGGAGDFDTAGTGSVSLFVTDAPSDEFEAVNATVEKIELIGGPRGSATIFEGRETFDLLALRDASELLSFTGEVPVGRYRKIRMRLAAGGLEIVREDGTTDYPTLTSDRTIDLSPAEDLEVERGRLLAVEMDIDVDRSFEADGRSAGGYAFNPVIFTRAIRKVTDGRLARLHGKLRNIDEENQSFELCHMKRPRAWLVDDARHGVRSRPGDAEVPAGVSAARTSIERADERHHPRKRCIAVNFAAGASIFDAHADSLEIVTADLEGEEATVAGRIHPVDEELSLTAFVMLLGPRGNFDHRVGIASGEYDATTQQFTLSRPFGRGEIIVQLSDATKLFEKGGVEVGPDAIVDGVRAGATGILFMGDAEGDPDIMKTVIVSLQLEEPDWEPLRGEVVGLVSGSDLELGDCPLEIALESGEIEGIGLSRRTALFRNDPEAMKSVRIKFGDLVLGETVSVFGRPVAEDAPETDACYRARVIMAYAGGGGE